MLVSDHPLAQGFYLTDGEADVVVPSVDPGCNYIVVREYLRFPFPLHNVHCLPQSWATRGTQAHNSLLKSEDATLPSFTSHLHNTSDTVLYWTLDRMMWTLYC
jgi:hypothetical protein